MQSDRKMSAHANGSAPTNLMKRMISEVRAGTVWQQMALNAMKGTMRVCEGDRSWEMVGNVPLCSAR